MLNIGIIGSGFGLYGLLPAFYTLKNCQVVAVCATHPQRIKKYVYSRGLTNIYSNWRHMLAKEKLDVLAIAVTPKAQYEIAKVAIPKGIHIFAEKPLADTYNHAKHLYKLAKRYHITHAVDFIFPEIDTWREIKKLLDDEKYGKLTFVSVNWDFLSYDIQNQISSWKTDATQGGGALTFYFCHVLYYLEYFAGEIVDLKSNLVHSKKSVRGADVGADLLFRFSNNIRGSAHISCNTIGLNRHQLIFLCEKATIILENKNSFVRNFKIKIYTDSGKKSTIIKKGAQADNEKARVDLVKKIAKRFIRACRNKQQMKPSFVQGVRVAQLIESIRAKEVW